MLKRFFILLLSVVLLFTMTACFPVSFILGFSEGMAEGLSDPKDNVDSPATPSHEGPEVPEASEASMEEILFRDIPWGCNPTTANELMGGGMFLSQDRFIKNWDYAYDPYRSGSYQGGHILSDTGGDVAGYPVSFTTMYFMYSLDPELDRSVEGSEFYLANYQFDVVDVDSAYADLKDKLTALYGTGKETHDTVTHSQWAVVGDGYSGTYNVMEKVITWSGANETQIVLVCSILLDDVDVFNSNYLFLTYGKTDIEQRIEDLNEAILEEKAREEANNRDSDNTNGL